MRSAAVSDRSSPNLSPTTPVISQSLRLSSLLDHCKTCPSCGVSTIRNIRSNAEERAHADRSYSAYLPRARNFISEPELTPRKTGRGHYRARLWLPDVANASWRANEFIVARASRHSPPRCFEMRWGRESERYEGMENGWGCSILSSLPEIIRRAVTKWNVPRVMTAPGNALVDRTTELRERCRTNYFSRVVTLRNYCVAISGSRRSTSSRYRKKINVTKLFTKELHKSETCGRHVSKLYCTNKTFGEIF